MKLPKIVTKYKLRDARICKLWAQDLKSTADIGEMVGITSRQVNTILYKNKDFLNFNTDWEKKKRIRWLKLQISKKKDTNKDPADLLEQLRKEIEGEKPLIDNSQHFNYNIRWKKPDEDLSLLQDRTKTQDLAG